MFLQGLIDNINTRLPKDTNNISPVFSVLSLTMLSFANAAYGTDEIKTQGEHYGGEQALIYKEQTMVKWSYQKHLVKIQQYPTNVPDHMTHVPNLPGKTSRTTHSLRNSIK